MAALRRVLIALVLTALVAGGVLAAIIALYDYDARPLPLADQCVARVAGQSVMLDTDQAHYASIITGVATQRGLVPRAATIGLATAYQESGIHNLDYGDRDSLGLFQQRPSQGWGTNEQVQDPWYAANRFYAALVKVDGWETGDVNDVAQAVQRSGHPNGYARHVENARRVASALTGETPASFTCLVKDPPAADPHGFETFAGKTLPDSVRITRHADRVTLRAPSNRAAWSAAQIAVANTSRFGVVRVTVGGQEWTASRTGPAPWTGEKDNGRVAEVWFDVAPTPSPEPTPR